MKHEKRNMEQLRAQMAALAKMDPANLTSPTPTPTPPPVLDLEPEDSSKIPSAADDTLPPMVDLDNPGLTRAQLEDRRWKISAPVAEAAFLQVGIRLEGRSARKIYVWPVIFRIEGVPEDVADCATPDTHPELFDDLIDAKAAAGSLKVSQPHLRKQVDAGCLSHCDIIRLGARGMYRFRPRQIGAEARRRIEVRLVGGISRCAP